jgi:hypothetical protein
LPFPSHFSQPHVLNPTYRAIFTRSPLASPTSNAHFKRLAKISASCY